MGRSKVLFLCTHNSARSQIAEGLLRHFYGDRYEVFSAGATPTRVHPLAIKVMAEIGVDISGQSSKSIEEFRGREIDLVVTVCRNTPKLPCPFCFSPGMEGRPPLVSETLPGAKRFIEHGFSDPSDAEGSDEEKTEAFRRVRDEIKEWIFGYFTDITMEELDSNRNSVRRDEPRHQKERGMGYGDFLILGSATADRATAKTATSPRGIANWLTGMMVQTTGLGQNLTKKAPPL